jgi:multidrug efflux pump subunit AcrB
VPLSTLVDSVVKVAPLVVNHQGQFPSVTISFHLRRDRLGGQRHTSDSKGTAPAAVPSDSFQGNAQAFGASLKTTPILIIALLLVIYTRAFAANVDVTVVRITNKAMSPALQLAVEFVEHEVT